MRLDWTPFKGAINAGGLLFRYFELDDCYLIFAVDEPFTFECTLPKDGGADQIDFDGNYKAKASPSVSQFDTDGAQIVRNKAAKKGWTFCSMPIEIATSRLQSGNTDATDDMYAKDYLGNARTFITHKIYDNSDVEITAPGLLGANYNTAVKSVIDFEPPYDYEVIGGDIRTLSAINADIRLWLIAVPDIAAPTGSKEMGGGINLRYLSPGNVWEVDGRVTKFATYNASFHTNKIRLLLKYAAGTHENLQVIIQLYKL